MVIFFDSLGLIECRFLSCKSWKYDILISHKRSTRSRRANDDGGGGGDNRKVNVILKPNQTKNRFKHKIARQTNEKKIASKILAKNDNRHEMKKKKPRKMVSVCVCDRCGSAWARQRLCQFKKTLVQNCWHNRYRDLRAKRRETICELEENTIDWPNSTRHVCTIRHNRLAREKVFFFFLRSIFLHIYATGVNITWYI